MVIHMAVSSKHSHWLTDGMYHHAVADLWQIRIIKLMLNSNPKSPVYDFFFDYIYLVSSPSIPGSMQMSQFPNQRMVVTLDRVAWT